MFKSTKAVRRTTSADCGNMYSKRCKKPTFFKMKPLIVGKLLTKNDSKLSFH